MGKAYRFSLGHFLEIKISERYDHFFKNIKIMMVVYLQLHIFIGEQSRKGRENLSCYPKIVEKCMDGYLSTRCTVVREKLTLFTA
jgi:hypothetical protein